MPRCRQCHVEFPNHACIDGKKRNLQRRKFCLICSPFGMHNTSMKTPLSPKRGPRPTVRIRPRVTGVDDECRVCGVTLRRRRGGRCAACNTLVRRYRCKLAAVTLLGGKCASCGWAGHPAGFQFHHRDPSLKEFQIGNVANRRWAFVLKELEKCVLLCATCHQIKHSVRRFHPRVIEEAMRGWSPDNPR